MAMSPNCRTLAVTNASSGTVSFVDVDPTSLTFHTVVGETRVGPGPGACVYQSEGEDILVIHPHSNKLTLIQAIDLQVRKQVEGFLNEPIDLVTTPRFAGFGANSGLYYAYILNRNGTVAIYESGPDGVNGIGFNDIIGTVPTLTFRNARSMSPLTNSLMGGALISHSDELGNGVVTKLELVTTPGAPLPIQQQQGGFILPPTFRQQEWGAVQVFGGVDPSNPNKDLLSGRAPGEIMYDEMMNRAGWPRVGNQFNTAVPLTPMLHSEKNQVKVTPTGAVVQVAVPKFVFISLVDRGLVDVFDAGTAQKVFTIDVGGTPSVLAGYWRQ
jgi:hypothetical protein